MQECVGKTGKPLKLLGDREYKPERHPEGGIFLHHHQLSLEDSKVDLLSGEPGRYMAASS